MNDESHPLPSEPIRSSAGQWETDTEPRRKNQTPECRLMVAVLQDAMKCMKWHDVGDHGERLLSLQAKRWFFAVDGNRPYSFLWICRGLELDSEAVRLRLGMDRW